MKRGSWFRATVTAGVVLAAGVGLLGSKALWAQATTAKTYLALATGFQETPSVDTPAVAFARLTLTADNKMNYEVFVAGLKGKFTAMHLHRARPGVAGGVIYPLGVPAADKPNVIVGSFDFLPADQADLDSQGIYLNIHTDQFPGGEIRGQVVQSPPSVQITTKP